MRTGKLTEAVLKRSVLRPLHRPDAVRTEMRYGADCAVLPAEDGQMPVCTAVSAAPGYADRPEVLVTAVVNNLAAAGAEPQALLLHILLPEECEEIVLRDAMNRISAQAASYGMEVSGGHTEVTGAVNRPQFLLTGIGRSDPERCRCRELLQPGQELVVTKRIALAGTAAIARMHEEELKKRCPFSLIRRAKEFEQQMSVLEEARAAVRSGRYAMHDLSQGGIFGALWEMAERAGVGLEIDLRAIPVYQETIELCEYFDINPYCLYSAGSLLVGTDCGAALVGELAGAGISAAVIGRVTAGRDRVLHNGDEIRCLDRPPQDEWYRRFEKGTI